MVSRLYGWRCVCIHGKGIEKPRIESFAPIQNGTPAKHLEKALGRLIAARGGMANLVKGQNAEDSKVGKPGSGLCAERPNGPGNHIRTGHTSQLGSEGAPYSV